MVWWYVGGISVMFDGTVAVFVVWYFGGVFGGRLAVVWWYWGPATDRFRDRPTGPPTHRSPDRPPTGPEFVCLYVFFNRKP